MTHVDLLHPSLIKPYGSLARLLCISLMVLSAVGLVACGAKPDAAKSGQALARVNGEEITALQLNEELRSSGATAAQAQQQSVAKQLLESLVERQLIVNAAMQDHIDRDPQVVRAIERAKALLIAQAYVQKKLSAGFKPTATEVNDYYAANPQFFADRKQLDMRQLVLAGDITPELMRVIDGARTLDEVATYLDAHRISYGRNQINPTTADFSKEASAKLLSMSRGQLFLVREPQRSVLSVVLDVRDAPVSREVAAPQIEQFLVANKNKMAVATEVARLRGVAKIEYLNKAAEAPAPTAASLSASAPAGESDAIARGVAGLK